MFVLFYPSEWVLPAIPLLLLIKLGGNFISDQNRIIEQLEAGESIAEKLGLTHRPNSINPLQSTSNQLEDEEDQLYDDDDDEDENEDEKLAAIGFLGKIRQYQKQLARLQSAIGKTCDKIEAIQK